MQVGANFADLTSIVRDEELHTVCEEARCPNIYECWEEREATFLIGGDHCTRRCAFCDVTMRRADGSILTADLHTVDLCAQRPDGQRISLEYWRGTLTAVTATDGSPQETDDNPEYNWRFGYVMTGMLVLLWIIFGIGGLIPVPAWRARRALLRASTRSGT